MRLSSVRLLSLALLALALPASADDWSRFRGPNGSGLGEARLPVRFGPEENLDWSVPVPFGRSSPVIGGTLVFLTAEDGDELVTMALDSDSGETVWRRAVGKRQTAELYHGTDSATPTPVTDGRNVYVFFHEFGLLSYDREGTERWQLPLGPFRNFYGIAASPVLADGMVILVADQAIGSFVVAVDAASGAVRWRQERPGRIESYSTPVLYPDDEPELVLLLGSGWIDAYDIATGEVRWSSPGVGIGPVASPVLDGDLLVVSAPDQAEEPLPPFEVVLEEHDADASGTLVPNELTGTWMANHFGFLDPDSSGEISRQDWDLLNDVMASDAWGVYGLRLPVEGGPPESLWNIRQSVPYISTPLIYDGVVYLIKDSILTRLDRSSGEVLGRVRLGAGQSKVYASPVVADGKILIATVDGTIVVLSPGGDGEIVARNAFESEIYATPAIRHGHLYVRTRDRLFRFSSTQSVAGR